jgi:transposase InsO family protein
MPQHQHPLGPRHGRVVIADWKEDYNHRRRRSAIGYQDPAQYAMNCIHR